METQEEKRNRQFIKMTQEPIEKLLFTLSVPTIISMLVTTLYNVVDTAFVGTLGTSESGATGIVFGYMAILQAIAFLCGQGAGSIMSRMLGAKDLEQATKYTSTGFFFSFMLGLLVAVFSAINIDSLVMALGSTVTIAPYAKTYMYFIMLSAPFFTSSLTMNNLLRYEGRAKLGTIGMMTGAVLNVGMDALFMFGLKLGIAGAGLATSISQFISWSILLSMFLRKRTQTKIGFRYISTELTTFWEIFATGFPSLLRQSLNSIATMLLNRAAREYGDSAVAAMSCVSRISFFPMAVALGIGQGFQPISGFNYGAGLKNRVRAAFKAALIASTLALILISIPIFIKAPFFISLLRDDPRVIETGTRALRLMAVCQVFVPLTMMVEMGFQSTGQKLLASVGSSLRSGLVFIPVLMHLSKVRGLAGIQEAQPFSFLLTFGVCLILLKVYWNRLKD